jgi:hypothetical protein
VRAASRTVSRVRRECRDTPGSRRAPAMLGSTGSGLASSRASTRGDPARDRKAPSEEGPGVKRAATVRGFMHVSYHIFGGGRGLFAPDALDCGAARILSGSHLSGGGNNHQKSLRPGKRPYPVHLQSVDGPITKRIALQQEIMQRGNGRTDGSANGETYDGPVVARNRQQPAVIINSAMRRRPYTLKL